MRLAASSPLWAIPADCAFPCATQNEIRARDAAALLASGVMLVCEGANMPTSPDGVEQFIAAGILYGPGKAANAGGVAVSAGGDFGVPFDWPAASASNIAFIVAVWGSSRAAMSNPRAFSHCSKFTEVDPLWVPGESDAATAAEVWGSAPRATNEISLRTASRAITSGPATSRPLTTVFLPASHAPAATATASPSLVAPT